MALQWHLVGIRADMAAVPLPVKPIDYAVAVPSLIGSLLSAVGAGFIVLAYIVLPLNARHVRHILILNLATAGKLPRGSRS